MLGNIWNRAIAPMGAGIVVAMGLGVLVHTFDRATGNELRSFAISAENRLYETYAKSSSGVPPLVESLKTHPGGSLNLAIFLIGTGAGAMCWRRLQKKRGDGAVAPT